MKRKTFYFITIIIIIIIIVVVLGLGLLLWRPKPHQLQFRQVAFSNLPGWKSADTRFSLRAFQTSCKAFIKQDPNKPVGSEYVDLQAKDWLPACHAALSLNATSQKSVKAFFQEWFMPVEFFDKKPVHGLFTGYYMPLLQGSLTKTNKFNVPLYGLPKKMVSIHLNRFDPKWKGRRLVGRVKGKQVVPFYTREEINKGAISKDTPVIAWVDSWIDRSFLEIQGSGIIELTNGEQLVVGYAGENGAPYTAVAKVLIDQGVMTRDNASMQHIRSYLTTHQEKLHAVLNKNKSFVFFEALPNKEALGSQGVALTPGYSMAIDRKWVPMGAPIWLSTKKPVHNSDRQTVFQRLLVAQDTGGAIKGIVRGDVYWGAGAHATSMAGKMKNDGHYWLLLPRHIFDRLRNKLA